MAKIKATDPKNVKEFAKEYGFREIRNATFSWVKKGSPLHPDKLRAFMIDHIMARRQWNKKGIGIGFFISLNPDEYHRKYFAKTHSYPSVTRKEMKRIVELRLASNNAPIAQIGTRRKAEKLARQLVKEYKESIKIVTVYRHPDINRCDSLIEYDPPRGDYYIFGTGAPVKNFTELKID